MYRQWLKKERQQCRWKRQAHSIFPAAFPFTQVFIRRVAGKVNWKHAKRILVSSFICDPILYWMSPWVWHWRKRSNKKNTNNFIFELGKFYMASRLVWNYPSANDFIYIYIYFCFFLIKREVRTGSHSLRSRSLPGFWNFCKISLYSELCSM